MVDFGKRLSSKKIEAVIDPIALYDTLDRAHDKGPLRPAQIAALNSWFSSRRDERDLIIKLHTGQGKTLIGLLMLQSRLNEKKGPVLYLCPDNYLVKQTCEQARGFGIPTCVADPDLPPEFHEGKSILVTSVQKLFNGKTKFGLNRHSEKVGTILMDDAHACSDKIRAACQIKIPKDDPAYDSIFTLFSSDLERQGPGTYADIKNKKHDALLPVPYWAWIDRESDVAKILSRASEREAIKFAWPLLKDILKNCQCIMSGASLEIEPYIPPLESFGTYWKADHRIFMSATVTDDAFLIKGLELAPSVITKPLTYENERWSGEKMVLIPALIHHELDRMEVVHQFSHPVPGRRFGVVALVSSFKGTKDWQSYGAIVANKETIENCIDNLRRDKGDNCLVLVNRYDGIDLPDNSCRILIFDGTPHSESLVDLYQEACRPNTESTLIRNIRTIEQGLGRSVRGEKDYSVIIITGGDLTKLIRDRNSRKFLSNQMATQISIGLEITEMAKQEIEETGKKPKEAFLGLVQQCLQRDPTWKAFYAEQMASVSPSGANGKMLQLYQSELKAEKSYCAGHYVEAAKEIQNLLDRHIIDSIDRMDKGWYLQEMARYNYEADRPESSRLQKAAHATNKLLLKPTTGVAITRLQTVSHKRMEQIIKWVASFGEYEQLSVAVGDITSRLAFGVKADSFEQALNELSQALGFNGERPDKEWKEGPDNLWALNDTQYIVWECKNEVDINRSDISKSEAEQMSSSCAWFDKEYRGCTSRNIIIHPANTLAQGVAFTHKVEVMRETELKMLLKKVKAFFAAFERSDFSDLSSKRIQELVDTNGLSVPSLLKDYAKEARDKK